MKTDAYLLPYTKLNFKWIKDLNIKPDTLNLIKRKREIGLNSLVYENTKIYWELKAKKITQFKNGLQN